MPRDRRTRRDLHALDADGMVLCNPRDREAAHRAEAEGIATGDVAAVTCRKCLELLHRQRRDRPDARPPADRPTETLFPASWDAGDHFARPPLVRFLRDLSAIAYCDASAGADRLLRLPQVPGLRGVLHVGRGPLGMHAWSVPVDGDMVVAFRGTQSVASVVQDLRFIRERTPDGGLHGGFAAGYASLHDDLVTRLRRSRARRVWLTGHSLGGALAVVAADRLADAGHDVAGVVTFGQPRVCLGDLASSLGPRLHRRYLAWVNDGDVVPKLVLPYVHFGWRLSYDGDSVSRRDMSTRTLVARGASAAVGDDGEGMDDAALDALIEVMEGGSAAAQAGGDERLVTGKVSDMIVGPHGLDHYAAAVERWMATPEPATDAAAIESTDPGGSAS